MSRTCLQCGGAFTVDFPSRPTRFCSRPCARAAERSAPVVKACAFCGGTFSVAFRMRAQRFCSYRCKADSQRGTRPHNYARVSHHCPICRRTFLASPSQKRVTCSKACFDALQTRPDGQRYRTMTVAGRRVYVHRWVMEQVLGRRLERREQVHHLNGNKHDNRLQNLQVVDIADHAVLTSRQVSAQRHRLLEARRPLP